jgi:HD-GYP domain-containing protein (c-di-GMP phosphodiesterase class II)
MLELEHLYETTERAESATTSRVYGEIGAVLRDEMRQDDSAARWDDLNRFMIVLPGASREVAAHVGRRLELAVRRVLTANLLEAPVAVCVGIAVSSDDGRQADALIAAAHEMMSYARRLGGGIYASSRDTSEVEHLEDDSTNEISYITTRVSIRALLSALEAHSPSTAEHGRRVARYAVALARATGFPADDIPILKAAALLHDVGMLGVPIEIIEKPGPLTGPEYHDIQRHADIGYQLLRSTPWLQTSATYIRYHHESFSGSGYPEGFKGAAIPLASRIIAVAEAFDTMTVATPYRAAMTPSEAIMAMRVAESAQFDSKVVLAMEGLAREQLPPTQVDAQVDLSAPIAHGPAAPQTT